MDNEPLYDVAVIGGGLAGLSLAIQCARQGYSVVLFEKEEYPFHKVCGEYISLESRDFLSGFGVDLDSFKVPLINKLQLSDVKGRIYSFNLPLGGFGISRYSLDDTLYKIAVANGVTVYTGTKVNNVEYINDEFRISATTIVAMAKVAAGSYGKRSNLDVKWKRPFTNRSGNLNNYIGIKYHIKYPHNISTITLHNFYKGYCGISAIEAGKSCLCYLTTAKNLKDSGSSIKEMERQVLFKNPRLREIFTAAEFLYDEPLAISQISFSRKSTVENHVLMLGDAAGMITPLCGNGMSMAMHSGKIAFHSINRYLQKKINRQEMEEEYTRSWKNTFTRRLSTGRIIQQFFGNNTSTSLFLKTMNAVPPLANFLIRSTHGKPF